MPCARAASGETSDAATVAANIIWNFTLRYFPDVERPPHTSAMRALARALHGGAVSGGDEKTPKQNDHNKPASKITGSSDTSSAAIEKSPPGSRRDRRLPRATVTSVGRSWHE